MPVIKTTDPIKVIDHPLVSEPIKQEPKEDGAIKEEDGKVYTNGDVIEFDGLD